MSVIETLYTFVSFITKDAGERASIYFHFGGSDPLMIQPTPDAKGPKAGRPKPQETLLVSKRLLTSFFQSFAPRGSNKNEVRPDQVIDGINRLDEMTLRNEVKNSLGLNTKIVLHNEVSASYMVLVNALDRMAKTEKESNIYHAFFLHIYNMKDNDGAYFFQPNTSGVSAKTINAMTKDVLKHYFKDGGTDTNATLERVLAYIEENWMASEKDIQFMATTYGHEQE